MVECNIVVVDNSLYAQNQDVLPSRINVQVDIIRTFISQLHCESNLGIFPLYQDFPNNILAPTSEKPLLNTFLLNIDLTNKVSNALESSLAAMNFRKFSDKTVFIFLHSEVDIDELCARCVELMSNKVKVKIAFFGGALEFADAIVDVLKDLDFFSSIRIGLGDDFYTKVMEFYTEQVAEIDHDLELAMRLSLKDSQPRVN